MNTYRVEALEKFVVRTVYFVEADGPQEAEELCRSGNVAYETKKTEEGDEEWIETVSVKPDDEARDETIIKNQLRRPRWMIPAISRIAW